MTRGAQPSEPDSEAEAEIDPEAGADSESSPDPRWRWVPLGAAVAAHGLSLGNDFVLDDAALITNNPYARSVDGLFVMLRSSLFAASGEPMATDYYRPCAALLNWLSWQLVGDSRVGQHGINVLLHVAICALLLSILRRRLPLRHAAAATTLFAVHPATVEVVAYAGGRQDMLGWVFLLGAWRLALATKRALPLALLGAGATILGAFSREALFAGAAVLPLGLVGAGPLVRQLRRPAAAAAGVGAGVLVVSAARAAVGVGWSQPRDPASWGTWIQWAAATLLRPLQTAVAPVDLATSLVPPLPSVAVSALVIAGAMATGVGAWRVARGPWASLRPFVLFGHAGLLALTVVHTPVAVIFGSTSDRYSYPFLLCLTVLLAPLATVGAAKMRPALGDSPLRPLLRALPWIAAVVVLPLTLARVVVWRDEASLMRQQYLDRPHDPLAWMAEAERRLRKGDCEGALPLCQAYVERFPKTHSTDPCFGLCFHALGQPARAEAPLRRLVRRQPYRDDARRALFDVLFFLRRHDEVQAVLDELGPAYADAPDVRRARGELAHLRGDGP